MARLSLGLVLVGCGISMVEGFAPGSSPGLLPACLPRAREQSCLLALRCALPCAEASAVATTTAGVSRRKVLHRLAVAAAGSLGGVAPAAAQRPPPRPKVSSVPIECKQAGGCAMDDDMNAGMPKFESAGGTSEVLDTKNGKYSTGLKVQEISAGDEDGPQVGDASFVQCQYVLRRANGYFVDASYGFDRFDTFDFKMGKGKVIAGFEEALRGMHPGGRRRFVVPPELGYIQGVGDNKPGPMPPGWGEKRALESHRREPLVFEVQVVKVKNRDDNSE